MGRRIIFLIAIALQVIAWVVVLGHRVSINGAGGQSLFGIAISYNVSWMLRAMEGGVLILTALTIMRIGFKVVYFWMLEDPVVRTGICKRCGYDMRGSTIQCPECGYVVERITPST